MTNRRARIERVLTGVLKQAFADAGTLHFDVAGTGSEADFVRSLCEQAGGSPGGGLRVDTASKTVLLLGAVPHADVLPLGDLYHTQIVALIGPAELGAPARELASLCGGAETLDGALQRLFDERRPWSHATRDLSGPAAQELKRHLDAARFQRTRVGLVPKLGSRTLGIDLYA